MRQTSPGPAFVEWDDFSIAQATADRPVTRGLHIGFSAPSCEHVDAYWRAGVDAGHRDAGAPGRGRSTPTTTTAGSCSTPDGNSIEVVDHHRARRGI